MSDTASRNPAFAVQMLADALLRTVAGTTATFRVAAATADNALGGECGGQCCSAERRRI